MKNQSKILAIVLTLMLLCGIIPPVSLASPDERYQYNQPGDKNYVSNTNVIQGFLPTGSSNNQSYKVTAPRAQADAAFTTEPVIVDGIRDAAWDAAVSYPIANKFNAAMTADAPAATAAGSLRLMWDGPVLYALVEVTGDSTKSDTGTPAWSSASFTPSTDGLFVCMDVFNDQWGMENDTQGVFFLPANPAAPATSFNNSGIPSLGSFFNPNNQDYSNRLKAYKSSGYASGTGVNYTYEIALQTEGWGDAWARELKNGTKIGLEFGIFDQGKSFTYWSKTQYYAGNEGGSNLPNSERVRNRDWGEVALSGWDGATPFAYSGWRADENIRFWNSRSNPGGTGAADSGDGSLVWTPASKARMISAKNAYSGIKDSAVATRAEKEAAVLEVCKAFAGLRWADTKYPDPHDLPASNTLPNVWEFFDKAKGTNGMVTNTQEWDERKKEILDLAQFYEYGYKPRLGVDYNITLVTNSYSGTGSPSVTARVTPTNVNYSGGVYQDVTISITLPTAGAPAGQKAPVSFGGSWTANGIANISYPSWGTDQRTDATAWGTRSGTFYKLFPYFRNSTSADSSIEIANATAVSVYLDILQMAAAQNASLDERIDPTRAITKGFSINGKIAFVSAVFDERVKAVVCGGAGATGPANWRYNATGQEYSFSSNAGDLSNLFYNAGAESIVSHGTEGPGNSYRHNRVRETELFRHFLPYGHEYAHEDGSYGYGSFSRLPFDQASLVATFAPDRAIIIDTNLNDYNDGAVTDNMSLQVAKYVYKTLGVDGDNYVKFNTGSYVSSGDPHGSASATSEGHYLSDLFYGTATLTTAEALRLNTDPYNLNVSNGKTQTPYDYYWGGFNTITGGTGGVEGKNGWCYYTMALSPETVITVQPFSKKDLLLGYSAGPVLSVKAESRSGPGTLSYQWYSNTTKSAAGGTPIDGAVSPAFTVPAGLSAGQYYYYVVVRSDSGAPDCTSDIAQISVRAAAADTSVKSVAITVSGTAYSGIPDTTTTASLVYNVAVPYGTNLNGIAASAVAVTANDKNATVGTPMKLDSGARWTALVTAEDGTATTCTINVTAPFVPITAITGVPSKITPLVLPSDGGATTTSGGLLLSYISKSSGTIYYKLGNIEPANATNKTITWSLKAGTTNADILTYVRSYNSTYNVSLANTTAVGATFVLTATVANGAAANANYVQDFTIEVVDPTAYTLAADITGVPSTGIAESPLLLTGAVQPENAVFRDLLWTVKTSTAPNATITGGNKLSTSGPGVVYVTAAVAGDVRILDNQQYPVPFAKDFSIEFLDPDAVAVSAAVAAIEAGTYQIPIADQLYQDAKTIWVRSAVNARIPPGNGSTATVSYDNGYKVSVTKGNSTKPAAITVSECDNSLENLILRAGSLTWTFFDNSTSADDLVKVDNSISSVTVTPVAKSANAAIRVNGNGVASGGTSQDISLNVGNNQVSIVVTASDGTPKTYILTVVRAEDSNIGDVDAAVSAIEGGTYQIPIASQTSWETKTAWVQEAVNARIPLGNGSTATVTYDNGYKVSVNKGSITKPAAITVSECDNSLSSLTVSAGTLTPVFSSITTGYSISVGNNVSGITAIPVARSASAAVTVNGKIVASGQASQTISLNVGKNTISIVVTASDGAQKTYAITVTRAEASASGGSNSSNDSTPPTTPAPPTQTQTPVPPGSIVTMKPTLSGSTGVIRLEDDKAKELLAKDTTITVPEIAGAKAYLIGLSAASLSSGTGDGSLTVSTGAGKIKIPDNMLSGVSGITGKEAGIAIGQGNKADLPAEIKAALGDRPIVQLTLSVDGKQAEWSNPNAPVSVSMPYKPTAEELKNPDSIVVWYIDGSGKVITVPSGRYDAKTGAVTFEATHFSQYAVAYMQKNFSDLGKAAWAEKSIKALAVKDILKTSGDAFQPDNGITRADFLYSLVRTLGLAAKTNGNFVDIGKDAYYSNEIAVAKALGITTGEGGNKFGPDSGITRQDMMTMTERALRLLKKIDKQSQTSILDRFTDKNSISSYAVNGVAAIVNEGLILGSNNRINPAGNATRAEAAVFLYRIYNKY
jgi:hypothetical protein